MQFNLPNSRVFRLPLIGRQYGDTACATTLACQALRIEDRDWGV
jgi:hypothetical protein